MADEGETPKKSRARKAQPEKPKPKARAKSKPEKDAPQVCKRCGKKWAQHDKGGLCAKCAKEADGNLFPAAPPTGDADNPPPTPQELKRARIFEIARLMASGEWRPHMAKALGKLWALDKKTVQHYSAEASRLLDYTTNQRATLVNIARVRLLEVLQQDETDRVQAARTLLEHLGELRQNVTVKAPDPFEGWTDEEIKAYADTGQRPERLRGGRKK